MMSYNYPPDKYAPYNGAVWGTDIDFVDSASAKSADGYVRFLATTPAADPGFGSKDHLPIVEGHVYSIQSWMQASSVAAGNYVQLAIEWYDNAKSLVSTSYAHNAVLPGAAAWYDLAGKFEAPSTSKFAKPMVYKKNTAFTAYVNNIDFTKVPLGFEAYLSPLQPYTSGTIVVYNNEVYDYGSAYNHVTGTFTAQAAGIYVFNVLTGIASLNAGNYGGVVLHLNGGLHRFGQRLYAHTNGDYIYNNDSWALILARGDYINIVAAHDYGAARTFVAGACRFSGFQVE